MTCDRSITILPSFEEISAEQKAAFRRDVPSWRDAWTKSLNVHADWRSVFDHIGEGETDDFCSDFRRRARTTEGLQWSKDELDHCLDDLLATSAERPLEPMVADFFNGDRFLGRPAVNPPYTAGEMIMVDGTHPGRYEEWQTSCSDCGEKFRNGQQVVPSSAGGMRHIASSGHDYVARPLVRFDTDCGVCGEAFDDGDDTFVDRHAEGPAKHITRLVGRTITCKRLRSPTTTCGGKHSRESNGDDTNPPASALPILAY
jgi:hypothetical protein